MALFRHPVPRRAVLGALLGALYAVLVLSVSERFPFGALLALAWFLLSIGLLFLRPLAYHAYTTWAILWIVWRGVLWFQEREGALLSWFALEMLMPLASLWLLVTSGYLHVAEALRERP